MASWTDRYWNSAEGLRLHYRDYAGPRDKPPILCIPGLTRNARDFEPVADRYAGDWRVIAVDLRGRGESESDPDSRRYSPHYYVADILKLIDQALPAGRTRATRLLPAMPTSIPTGPRMTGTSSLAEFVTRPPTGSASSMTRGLPIILERRPIRPMKSAGRSTGHWLAGRSPSCAVNYRTYCRGT